MSLQFRSDKPCEDCVGGVCMENCSTPGKFVEWSAWEPAATAPKDGTHILVCNGRYDEHWTFNQSPPAVVHYWSNPGEEGFYLSNGLVDGSYNDTPFQFTRWQRLSAPPHEL